MLSVTTIANRQDAVNRGTRRREPVDGVPATAVRTAAGDAFSRFAIDVIRLSNVLGTAGDALARPAGQSSARWQVLAGAESGTATVADVARLLGLARQSVQRVADVLESEGLIVYEDNPRHRRAKRLVLTERGRAVLSTIQRAQAAWANELGRRLGERELSRASQQLERVLEFLSAKPARRPGRTATR